MAAHGDHALNSVKCGSVAKLAARLVDLAHHPALTLARHIIRLLVTPLGLPNVTNRPTTHGAAHSDQQMPGRALVALFQPLHKVAKLQPEAALHAVGPLLERLPLGKRGALAEGQHRHIAMTG